ncbi:hypothetical protein QN277_029170 [Acacia crassicarpa]|uniref:Uncharacterized protein n=1 Tax=Acacia crassicarpa TaxID=499986 RepID=A0AAE1MFX6_9FABA|nr:hypothetical protein QN277_029170 [Acacia crassicarpa]
MRNQKRVNVASTIGRKRAKKEIQKLTVKEEKPDEHESQCRDSGSGENDSGWILTHWDEHSYDWLWLGSVVDYEQMSWGSVWDMGLAGEAFSKLYGDVVWDDDIWNLRTQIPSSSCTN